MKRQLDETSRSPKIPVLQGGEDVNKVKLPTAHIEQPAARAVYESTGIPIGTAGERVRHVVQCAFNGWRIVIFSGGAHAEESQFLDEIRAIQAGGGFGSIVGRNAFQRARGRSEAAGPDHRHLRGTVSLLRPAGFPPTLGQGLPTRVRILRCRSAAEASKEPSRDRATG
jgi:hypothetical protein